MEKLNTQSINTIFNPPQSTWQSGGGFKFEVPESSVTIAKPLSYEFRVVEHMQGDDIVRVGLQYRVMEHDNYGMSFVLQNWTDVQRVKKDMTTGAIYE